MKLNEIIVLYYSILLVTIALTIVIVLMRNTLFKRKKRFSDRDYIIFYRRIIRRRKSSISILISLLIYFILGIIILKKYVFLAVVTSNSMSPTIKLYDLVLIQTIDRNPKVGDIILFKGKPADIERRELILHRVVKITEEGIYTKGDANPTIDPWIVKREEIVGKAVQIYNVPIKIPYLGKFLLETTESPTGRTYFQRIISYVKLHGIVIFFLIAIIYIVISYYENIRERHLENRLKEIIKSRGVK